MRFPLLMQIAAALFPVLSARGHHILANVSDTDWLETVPFVPDHVVANVGDVIRFTFMNGNHSVTQSSFETPCQRLPNGYDSNFLPGSGVTAPCPQWNLTINTTPLWFFCAQTMHYSRPTNHCADNMMVFAVNVDEADQSYILDATVPMPSDTALGSSKKIETVSGVVRGLVFLAALASLSIHPARRRRHDGSGAYNDGAQGTKKRSPLPVLPMQADQTPVQQLIHPRSRAASSSKKKTRASLRRRRCLRGGAPIACTITPDDEREFRAAGRRAGAERRDARA
ncbi:hypothetical protein DFH08DRAFT_937861 [Mycena albidolilacea]|uniref:Phytocyanin domain-containing protein n=1 Tax=Mycena albidolilacea TaxID=1033008 RepID=A0AAD6ZYB1_9AGAR|nr:hypothetical protein DFH08DRAFT_937861 [Mycena albidolilacea]